MLTAGQTFARYVIEAAIGEGGMGEVYRAYDEKLRRKVALKVLHRDLKVPDAAARLVREARAAAALQHPNAVAIFDLGEVDGQAYLVMELVSGVPLRAFIGDASIPVGERLRWLVDVARGLAAAHKAGLVHRDVKPANVMIGDDGVVKVLDFGLAKTVEKASLDTDVGIVVGTPKYMAAELFAGVRADARSDEYAFGVMAYELLSGVHPGSPMGQVPTALDALVPEVGPAIARIVARTLSRMPEERFGSMAEIASLLDAERLALGAARSTISEPPRTRKEPAPSLPFEPTALAGAEVPSTGPFTRASAGVVAPPASLARHTHAPLSEQLGSVNPPRRSSAPLVVLAFAVAGGLAYGATRIASGITTSGAVAADAAAGEVLDAELDGASLAEGEIPDAEGDAPEDADADVDDDASSDAGDDAEADAETEAGPAAAGWHVGPVETFEDPWRKTPPR